MEKSLFEITNLIAILASVSIPFLRMKKGAFLALGVITLMVFTNSALAFSIFNNGPAEIIYPGSWVTGPIPVRMDYLSAWFILVISFTFLTGCWYGAQYLKQYASQEDNLKLHFTAFVLLYASLIDICLVQNSIVFLIAWEVMAVSSFVVIIFEHQKRATLKAGINFLIQSHVSILFLTLAFMWVKVKSGSFDFNAISVFTLSEAGIGAFALFLFFFIGFGIKAGFVPFHTWLPLAHPAAPSHVSGIMSGVIIKTGIYGILRVLLNMKTDLIPIGYFILFISVISGLYGVMLAIIQHNLKKLLAYHSIENIGIIGIGIGLGVLGLGYNNPILIWTGFAGALLHVLNHSLFKSLLFFSAGNVYQATHTMNIESLGGLIKKIPHSGYLFLIASLAICGLPPFNGFVSEFFLYNGMFHGLVTGNFKLILFLLFAILGLVSIGGLALICFTKAFGTVFLGTPRERVEEYNIENRQRVWPMYLIGAMILIVGLFPLIFNNYLENIVRLYQPSSTGFSSEEILSQLTVIGWYSLGFLGLIALIYMSRQLITKKYVVTQNETWGCGYTGSAEKMQYTASSFIRTYRKLAEPLLLIKKEKADAKGLYPQKILNKTHALDKIEFWLIDKVLILFRRILNFFTFLQNGNFQAYLLYGIVFVGLALFIPLIYEKISTFIHFLNQL
jgi:formate hydrogenlyase subunit 3/multisubunit Na+/H+ antiporter MnhD subunit